MKRIYKQLLFLAVLTTFLACTEDYKDWANPQSNEQEEAVDLTLQATGAASTVFDLNAITAETVELIKASINNEEGTTVSFDGQIAKEDNFEENIALELTGNETALSTSVEALQEAVVAFYGKRPEGRKLFVRLNGYITAKSGQTSKVSSNSIEITVTPVAPIIESAYYLTGDVIGGWGPESIVKLNHSGKDVYEDPIFSIILNNPQNAANFKIIPQSGIEEGGDFWGSALGTAIDGDDSTEGTIMVKGEQEPGAIQVTNEGWVRITLDMMEYTYKIEPLDVSPYLWIPGNHQGWNPATAPQLYTANMDLVYNGHAYLDGGFKLTGQAAWGPTEYAYGYFSTLSETISDDGGNMVVDPGYYFMKVNLNAKSIEATVAQWGIVGSATPGGWDADTVMEYNKEANTWSITTDLTDGELKFRANNNWGINMGGSFDKLLFDKGNIAIEAGNYTLVLHLGNDDNSYCSVTKN